MQWSNKTDSAGFSDKLGVKPWLPVNDNYAYLNAEVIFRLNYYKSHMKAFKCFILIEFILVLS